MPSDEILLTLRSLLSPHCYSGTRGLALLERQTVPRECIDLEEHAPLEAHILHYSDSESQVSLPHCHHHHSWFLQLLLVFIPFRHIVWLHLFSPRHHSFEQQYHQYCMAHWFDLGMNSAMVSPTSSESTGIHVPVMSLTTLMVVKVSIPSWLGAFS